MMPHEYFKTRLSIFVHVHSKGAVALRDDPFEIVRRFDVILQRAEDTTIEAVIKSLATSYLKLEENLRRSHSKYLVDSLPSLSGIQRSALLLQEIKDLLNLMPPEIQGLLDTSTRTLLETAFQNGNALANSLLTNFDESVQIFLPTVPIEAVEFAANNTMTWLTGATSAFRATASSVVQQGLIQNRRVEWTAGVLRRTLGITKRDATSTIRTASLQATDAATRQAYELNSIDYVQRVATVDERVCGYCAQRAGNIYRLEDSVATLHLNCRCYLMPVKPEWFAAGLDDLEWARSHSRKVKASSRTLLNSGLSQFEKTSGLLEPPAPLWTEEGGFLDERFLSKSSAK